MEAIFVCVFPAFKQKTLTIQGLSYLKLLFQLSWTSQWDERSLTSPPFVRVQLAAKRS